MIGPLTLDGWDMVGNGDVEWIPWGGGDLARAKILGSADGYVVALVQADAGYRAEPHEHNFPEFLYIIDGRVRNQGREMSTGDGYAAATGSTHVDFETLTASTYLTVFKV